MYAMKNYSNKKAFKKVVSNFAKTWLEIADYGTKIGNRYIFIIKQWIRNILYILETANTKI